MAIFNCPTCGGGFTLAEYLQHAVNCGADPKNDGNTMVELVDSDYDTTNENAVVAPLTSNNRPPAIGVFTCPICSQGFTMSEYARHAPNCTLDKPSNTDKPEGENSRKRTHIGDEQPFAQLVDDGGIGVVIRTEPRQQISGHHMASGNRGPMMQPPMPNTPIVSLNSNSDTNGAAGQSSNAKRRSIPGQNPRRAQEQPQMISSRISAPMSQDSENTLGTAMPAVRADPIRRLENQIINFRRRLELFEASMMMKLTAIEAMITRTNEDRANQ